MNERNGERFISNEGYEFIITKYINYKNVWIEFQDEYKFKKKVSYKQCTEHNIKNPYHKSVYGVGCLGTMKDGTVPKIRQKYIKEYKLWHRMMTRCYNTNYHELEPTYKDATVCDRWLVFANFLEDIAFIEGYDLWINNEGYCLDKDIKGNGSKVYSLDNCCFITIKDNSKERNDRLGNPCKVTKVKVYGINIKTGERTRDFDSITEASKEVGISQASISYCLDGKQKTAKGFKWFRNND